MYLIRIVSIADKHASFNKANKKWLSKVKALDLIQQETDFKNKIMHIYKEIREKEKEGTWHLSRGGN